MLKYLAIISSHVDETTYLNLSTTPTKPQFLTRIISFLNAIKRTTSFCHDQWAWKNYPSKPRAVDLRFHVYVRQNDCLDVSCLEAFKGIIFLILLCRCFYLCFLLNKERLFCNFCCIISFKDKRTSFPIS